MYLNLDLLYNIDNYLFPLFYYKNAHWGWYSVYSPMTKKSIYKHNIYHLYVYYDFITKKFKNSWSITYYIVKNCIITENTIKCKGIIFNKTKPIKLESEYLYFLKNNIRINKNVILIMLCYLNLDLLYNIDNYLFPLFYYQSCNYKSSYRVYCPMTKKSIWVNPYYTICYDYITKKRYCKKSDRKFNFNDTKHIITENTIKYRIIIYNKCNPFKLNSEDLYFLKSNTRIN